ncbi:hypothetical protein [Nocardia abscessus]|uniref:hypothetical protein n=1 Tax=Nocardia abscessus TaxID=120957 RepID=UPI0024566469|nr:hypothetical protein [Nocardia abscessus]
MHIVQQRKAIERPPRSRGPGVGAPEVTEERLAEQRVGLGAQIGVTVARTVVVRPHGQVDERILGACLRARRTRHAAQ